MAISAELRSLIDVMLKKNASDLILTQGQPPIIRVVGELFPVADAKKLTSEEVQQLAYGLLTPEQQRYLSSWELGT